MAVDPLPVNRFMDHGLLPIETSEPWWVTGVVPGAPTDRSARFRRWRFDMRSRLATMVQGGRGLSSDSGMTTAEYAVGTVAACGFGGVLYKLLTSDSVVTLLKDIIKRALTMSF
jgi:hypothetical protein